MDSTTTRASTVIKSIPTREIRTQASITMPLSSTRSRTSIRLDPPDTRSTAIEGLLHQSGLTHLLLLLRLVRAARARGSSAGPGAGNCILLVGGWDSEAVRFGSNF